MKDRYIIDPSGKRRKIHYIPNYSGFGAHAWVRSGLFKKEHQYAAGIGVIDNLVKRLEKRGWRANDAD